MLSERTMFRPKRSPDVPMSARIPTSARPGINLMKLYFGRKAFGQIFTL
jgi:hypothetical protein